MILFKRSLNPESISKLPTSPSKIGLFAKSPSEKSFVNCENPRIEYVKNRINSAMNKLNNSNNTPELGNQNNTPELGNQNKTPELGNQFGGNDSLEEFERSYLVLIKAIGIFGDTYVMVKDSKGKYSYGSFRNCWFCNDRSRYGQC